MSLALKRKLYQQMAQAADRMGTNSLKKRYGPSPVDSMPMEPDGDQMGGPSDGDEDNTGGMSMILEPTDDDSTNEVVDGTDDGIDTQLMKRNRR